MTKGFAPIFDKNSKILILGTLPSETSLKNYELTKNEDYYFNFSHNQFWKIIAEALNVNHEKIINPSNYEYRKKILIENNIALWDIISYADRKKDSSKDVNINPETIIFNDIKSILSENIKTIIINGKGKKNAMGYFLKYCNEEILKPLSVALEDNDLHTKFYKWINEVKVYPMEATVNRNMKPHNKQQWVNIIRKNTSDNINTLPKAFIVKK